jgi:uncharacterized protein YodC (DUF2158 family)
MGLQVGDVVLLKSGSPAMTIEKMESANGELRALCTWFNENKREMSWFAIAVLEKYE